VIPNDVSKPSRGGTGNQTDSSIICASDEYLMEDKNRQRVYQTYSAHLSSTRSESLDASGISMHMTFRGLTLRSSFSAVSRMGFDSRIIATFQSRDICLPSKRLPCALQAIADFKHWDRLGGYFPIKLKAAFEKDRNPLRNEAW